jgi:toluene monooxygenase system protein E
MPSEYELVSSDLHYYTEKGFAVSTPVARWYRRYQEGSPLRCRDWERFRDPRETTYTRYTTLEDGRESFVDGLFAFTEESGYDQGLSAAWLETLGRVFTPLRYPGHGLQMLAAYVGQMAPGGRITIAALFQTADEIRRVQRIAERARSLELARPGFAPGGKAAWERDPIWQPLREAIERMLVTYDWGEAFVALNLVLKPMFDDLFMVRLADRARREGDPLLGELCFSLDEDCRWHRGWARALSKMAIEDTEGNREVIEGWIRKWYPEAARAVAAFAPVLEAEGAPALEDLLVSASS